MTGDTVVHKAAGDTIVHKALFAGAQAAAGNGKKVARRKDLPNLRVSDITYITCILFVALFFLWHGVLLLLFDLSLGK